MSKFAILLGGDLTPTQRLREQLRGHRVIAADSGMRHAGALGIMPELWVGDFDSTPQPLRDHHADVPRLTFPTAKDSTDGELAVREAIARGAAELILVGAFGGQFDHAMSHAAMLVGLAERHIPCMASSGHEEAWPLLNTLTLAGVRQGASLSIIGFSALKGLSISGVRWPLAKHDVEMGSTRTMSNEVTGDVEATLQQGRAVVVLNLGQDA